MFRRLFLLLSLLSIGVVSAWLVTPFNKLQRLPCATGRTPYFQASSSSDADTHPAAADPKQFSRSTPNTPTNGAAVSKISRLWQGVTLVRSAVQTVQQHHNRTTNTNNNNNVVISLPEWMEPLPEWMEPLFKNNRRSRRLQHNAAFKALTTWAFDKCDAAGDGRINRDELYAGILLVHLHLAKYVGMTACNPLNRTVVDELFDLAAKQDAWSLVVDGRQTIGREAFGEIVLLSCAKIASHVLVYYSLLVLFVPFVTQCLLAVWQQGVHGVSWAVVGSSSGGTTTAAAATATTTGTTATTISRYTHTLWALAEWTIQHFLSVFVVTTIMPWIFVQLQQVYARLFTNRPKEKSSLKSKTAETKKNKATSSNNSNNDNDKPKPNATNQTGESAQQ